MSEFGAEAKIPIGTRLIAVDELATILSTSERTVWRLLSAGRLVRPLRLGGRSVRWRLDEVSRWIDAGCPIVGGSDDQNRKPL
ncbi:MAG: helix-turn-helix domain-containing protein [Planctomycetota bacterium]|nr:helix-turn-helix domain-containing protein [Planctomycetaceae bacterium]MDQ3329846.1 helix-turn-helix domain-containing protein [Planctomycetota bacterium]